MKYLAALIVVLVCVSLSQAQYVIPVTVPTPYVAPVAVPYVAPVTAYPYVYPYIYNPYLIAPVPYAASCVGPHCPYSSPYVVVPWWHRGIYRRW